MNINTVHGPEAEALSSQIHTVNTLINITSSKVFFFFLICCTLFDSTGCGCRWGDLVVSQLFADSRAPHCGRGQVQEPGVDQRQKHCRSETFI